MNTIVTLASSEQGPTAVMGSDGMLSGSVSVVRSRLTNDFVAVMDSLFAAVESGDMTAKKAEVDVWKLLLHIGQLLLLALFAAMCRRRTAQAIEERRLSMQDVRLRMDQGYWISLMTTLGPVRFPLFAFRAPGSHAVVAPARELFPLHDKCRSSEVLLEWESLLGSEHPFRRAQTALTYFTHDAVALEDTTIERHAVAVGAAIPREWLYRPKEEIAEILGTRATRDRGTGRPILYLSTDAHALRRFVDDTWQSAWKMANGIRLWCVDNRTAEVIHLGGEFTWGDCNEVERIVRELQSSGVVPVDGTYESGVKAIICIVTDGLDWIEQHVLRLFPDAMAILDAYHAIEKLGEAAAAVHGKGTKAARRIYRRGLKQLGIRLPRRHVHHKRRGHKKQPARTRARRRALSATQRLGSGRRLLAMLRKHAPKPGTDGEKVYTGFLGYLQHNLYRMDYGSLRQRGFQIGSGAMESLHRTGSQLRLKLPGASWIKENAQAIFNLRMLARVDRWMEYWAQPDLTRRLVGSFTEQSNPSPHMSSGV
jgi:hypothetical protein